MEASYYIGIDISRQRLDWQVTDAQNTECATGQTVNSPKGIHKMIGRWKRGNIRLHELIVYFEHTGPYGLLLATLLEEAGICYVVVSAVQVQLSLGIRRGKSDPIDARRLAEYLWRFRDQLRPSRLPSKALLELRGWLLWRERLVKMRTALTNGIQANTLTSQVADLTEINQQMQTQHDQLTTQLKQVDRKIRRLLRRYNTTEGQYDLLVSIPGIGPVIAGWLLVYTEGFTRFSNARQLACFTGSAPFPKQSGQHRSPDRVSRWRCQRLKSLLLNGVHSAIQYDPELQAYYKRKCEEGKHPQSVRNAVICKLLYRVFAVINRGTPYVKIHQHEAAK
ncbi:IS110 family transposase [Fodinibius salsisoli]|uniref:IS110 family transposase n=1 Tax=Fodinibius salsisoli TaxID=2820877 RepID=A0ABT3PP98_9BACT|nr:IS110 family transposase [Fodinibius salsisoli]MCW9707659.1 IS110 family transposase [Fodinibius salsisoli]